MSLMKLSHVSKTFGKGDSKKLALDSIDLVVEKGTFIGLTGPSGSGKTTLLTIMGGLQGLTDGTIYFKDQEIGQLSEKERTKLRFNEFGFILQGSNLVPFLTVLEQFELVNKMKTKKESRNPEMMLRDLGVWDQRNQYPASLSGGQRQRVAIARALFGQPELIFADEPTASLDSKRAKQVAAQLADITKKTGQTIIMVSHDEDVLAYTDQTFFMRDGQLTKE
ncbi:ABC transporter ATP-binding protein [Dellaglioa sp. P0083]|uniref:ABC transporter ATP-binding protein n=1 Tax=Dellaglioa kimchii TaxID=3344667 RepID=UPI0038D491E6